MESKEKEPDLWGEQATQAFLDYGRGLRGSMSIGCKQGMLS